jgi:D-3-phosphoglycerate dehydrogenase
VREGKWNREKIEGSERRGKTLGLIGCGRIWEVARLAEAFRMKVIVGYRRSLKPVPGVKFVSLDELLAISDIISIHVPLTSETKHMVSTKEFEKMKRGVILINCARGGIVDEEALYQALKSGKVAEAALDVYEQEPPIGSPLLKLDCVTFTPHLGAITKESQQRTAKTIVGQVLKALRGEEPEYRVR